VEYTRSQVGIKRKWCLRFFRQILALLLILSSCLLSTLKTHAEDWPSFTENIESEGAVLMDAHSGTVLYAKNEHTHYYPASITKVLTAIVVLEHVDNLEKKVTFSTAATKDNLEQNSTVIAATAGDKLSVRDKLLEHGCMLLGRSLLAEALRFSRPVRTRR